MRNREDSQLGASVADTCQSQWPASSPHPGAKTASQVMLPETGTDNSRQVPLWK